LFRVLFCHLELAERFLVGIQKIKARNCITVVLVWFGFCTKPIEIFLQKKTQPDHPARTKLKAKSLQPAHCANQAKKIITATPVAFLLFAKMQTPRFSLCLTSPLSLRDRGVPAPLLRMQ
jgi:hypothetical protein